MRCLACYIKARKLLEDSKPLQNIAPENGARSISGLLAKDSVNDFLLKYNSQVAINSHIKKPA